MGALGVTVGVNHGRTGGIKPEIGRAEFALHPLTQIFPINLQFLMAARAFNEQTEGGDFDQAVDLL